MVLRGALSFSTLVFGKFIFSLFSKLRTYYLLSMIVSPTPDDMTLWKDTLPVTAILVFVSSHHASAALRANSQQMTPIADDNASGGFVQIRLWCEQSPSLSSSTLIA